jgi:hypothetical protein
MTGRTPSATAFGQPYFSSMASWARQFASQWVMNGGSIEKLKTLLGHYSVVMTERYAHLRPELFTAHDRDRALALGKEQQKLRYENAAGRR